MSAPHSTRSISNSTLKPPGRVVMIIRGHGFGEIDRLLRRAAERQSESNRLRRFKNRRKLRRHPVVCLRKTVRAPTGRLVQIRRNSSVFVVRMRAAEVRSKEGVGQKMLLGRV